jgi:pimeloyl-ACP methyl ester carboxylesterase
MTKKTLKLFACSAIILATLGPIACAPVEEEFREVTAERIGRPAFMIERKMTTGGMDFQLWERTHQRHAPANIYIEGDGHTKARNTIISGDPTPKNPVALHLASRDLADNVIYISRPCQFKESQDEKACSAQLWSERRFAPEVIAAYNEALDEVKKRWDITEFNIIGYDGGANIASVLAATRKDIASLRTVSGILNPSMTYSQTKETISPDSVLAMDLAPNLASMPQHHFIGAGDSYAPAAGYHSFRQAMGPSDCVHYTLVQDADHERGWVNKWPEFLESTTACPEAIEPYVPTQPLPPVPHSIEKP